MPSKTALTLSAMLLLVGAWGCSTEPPSVRVFNERSSKANLQIKPNSGNTFNINDVAGGTATGFQDISTGQYVVTASIQDESASPTVGFNASDDNNYTIVVVSGNPPTLRVDSSGK